MAIQNKNDMVKIFAVMAVDLNAKLLTELRLYTRLPTLGQHCRLELETRVREVSQLRTRTILGHFP